MKTTTLDLETLTPDVPELERDQDESPYEYALRLHDHKRKHSFASLPDHEPVVYSWLEVETQKSGSKFQLHTYGMDEDNDELGTLGHLQQVLDASSRLITFNGRRFDYPVLVLRAMTHRLPWPTAKWADERFERDYGRKLWHYDLYEILGFHGAARRISLNGLARLCKLPGKQGADGASVKKLWEAGRYEEVKRYCNHDVFTTWLLYLLWNITRGHDVSHVWAESIQFARSNEHLADVYTDFPTDIDLL